MQCQEADLGYVIESHLKLVNSVCRRYHPWAKSLNVDIEDCRQIGSMALFKAIHSYCGQCEFAKYAYVHIKKDVRAFLDRMSKIRDSETCILDAPIDNEEPDGTTIGEIIASCSDDDSELHLIEFISSLGFNEREVLGLLLLRWNDYEIGLIMRAPRKHVENVKSSLQKKWEAFERGEPALSSNTQHGSISKPVRVRQALLFWGNIKQYCAERQDILDQARKPEHDPLSGVDWSKPKIYRTNRVSDPTGNAVVFSGKKTSDHYRLFLDNTEKEIRAALEFQERMDAIIEKLIPIQQQVLLKWYRRKKSPDDIDRALSLEPGEAKRIEETSVNALSVFW